MNTHRKPTLLLAALLALAATAASADLIYSAPDAIREVPNHPRQVEVEIWTHRGDGARYCAGDPIEVYFRTNVDAWVAIYDLDTRGRVTKLFPTPNNRHNFVRGGEVNRLESRYGYHFEVEGPSGWETLRAVASLDRRALREVGWNPWKGGDWRDRDRERGYGHRLPAGYMPSALPASAATPPLSERIIEVPDEPHGGWEIAVDDARHYVKDGYRCRIPLKRPWWKR